MSAPCSRCRHENPPHSEAIINFDIRAISRIKFSKMWPRHGVVARPPAFCSRRVYDVTYVITQLCNNCITTVYQPHTIRSCTRDVRAVRVTSLPYSGEVRLSRGMPFAHDTRQVRHDSGSELFRKSQNDQVQIVLIIAAPSGRVASPPLDGEARLDSGMSCPRGSHGDIGLQGHFQLHVPHLHSVPPGGEATRGFLMCTRGRRK